MAWNKDIFNIASVIVPVKKSELERIITGSVVTGYVGVPYDSMVETLKAISIADEYTVTLNPNTIFIGSNNPLERNNVLIQVEGMQTYSEFVNNVVQGNEDESWTSFVTYSELFKDEIRNIKLAAYKKFLWNIHNMESWFDTMNIGLLTSDKSNMMTDFGVFMERVLQSGDYSSFVECCLDEDVAAAVSYLSRASCNVLSKHAVELRDHIMQNNKQQENIVLRHPIIVKVFVQSGVAGACRKDWPKIKFTVLDKKSFDTIGLWNGRG